VVDGAQRRPGVEREHQDSGEAERDAGGLGHAGGGPQPDGLHPQQQRQAEGDDGHGVARRRRHGRRCHLHADVVQVQAERVPDQGVEEEPEKEHHGHGPHILPLEGNGNRQEEQRRGGHSVEDEDVGVDAMVEGRLGEDEHACVDEQDDDGDQVSLLRRHHHGSDRMCL